MKPIKVFYSILSGRFYATRAYKETRPGQFVLTGHKDDVTNDIAREVIERDITFEKVEP